MRLRNVHRGISVTCPQCVQSQKAGWRKRHPGAPVPIGRPARAARRVSAAAPSHVKHGQFAVGNTAQRRERPAPAQVMGRRRLIQWEARLPRIIHDRLRSCTGCAIDPMDNPRPIAPMLRHPPTRSAAWTMQATVARRWNEAPAAQVSAARRPAGCGFSWSPRSTPARRLPRRRGRA